MSEEEEKKENPEKFEYRERLMECLKTTGYITDSEVGMCYYMTPTSLIDNRKLANEPKQDH